MPPPLSYPTELLSDIVAHLAACYPEEGCGLVARRGPAWRFLPIPNAATRYHLADPATFPHDARTAYLFDPVEQRRAWAWAAEEGWEIAAIVHSHCDADASFSARDRELALLAPGQPLYPGVEYLVVSILAGRADHARAHAWDGVGFSARDVVI
jgi:proteasome lid subunit RPN8/RPN11